MLLKDELKEALENITGKSISDASTTAGMLQNFNALYRCKTTFSVTPNTATVVVEDANGNVVTINGDGTYHLDVGSYTYCVSATGYTSITDKALTISQSDVTTGTKTVTETLTSKVCVVTFDVTPDTATIVVEDADGDVVTAETDGTYELVIGNYTYTITATDYTSITDKALVISATDAETGTKTVTETLTEV